MNARFSRAASTELSAVHLGNHVGYRVDGDMVTLNADIARCNAGAAQCNWRLQLWACREPFAGGHIDGIKVADVSAADVVWAPTSIEATAHATLPADDQYHAMVLTVASQDGKFATIHDYANFGLLQSFLLPRMTGRVGYRLDGDTVHIDVERIDNPRPSDNLSGTLSLELWALSHRYVGGEFEGVKLAGIDLGSLAGQGSLHDLSFALSRHEAVHGERHVVLMLREWTAAGYVTRNFTSFAQPVQFGPSPVPVLAENTTAKVLTSVLETVAPAAKKRANKAAAPAKTGKADAKAAAASSDQTVTREEVLRSRGRGRKLLAKVTALTQPRAKGGKSKNDGRPH